MGIFILKRLPVIIALLLVGALVCVALVGGLQELDNSVTTTFAAGGRDGGAPIEPPSGYTSEHCVRVGQLNPANPFRGWPVADTSLHTTSLITALFCDPTYPFSWAHEGLDFGFYLDAAVVATADATVAQVGFDPALGNLVVLCAANYCARYAHLNRISPTLVAGLPVQAGTVIGQVGGTGSNSTGVHLHYDIYSAVGFWDPLPTLYR